MAFFHGITFLEPVEGIRPILEKSMAIIGVIVTASAEAGAATEALDAAFPLNRPVRVNDFRAATALSTGGTMAKVLGAIADQGTPLTIVVRIPEGADQAETEANVVGGSVDGLYTGVKALLAAEGILGLRPRIIGMPGLDTQQAIVAAVAVAKKLDGMVYASCRGAETDTNEGATIYRGQFGDRELELIWPDWTGFDGHAIATALGQRAMTDERIGFHKSLSNVVAAGVTGISKDVHFDIRDSDNDAGVLNAAQVTTLICMNGYRFWGNRTCSDEPFFSFEVATRTAQALKDALTQIEAPYIDRPMTLGLIRDLVEEGNALLRRWTREGRIIGGNTWFDGTANPAESLAAGKLTMDVEYTSIAPLEALTNNLRVTTKYYSGFGDQLNAATA
ncbi:phage tail sheath protein FI [Sphingomonas kyeonggiensis]|uniref:phage tail sheath subtilisin-like domain-containing protein n=1 Tax=Sphingomonas kyeonggiensis TaxID=1268553 RepID=UPI00277D6036|nr:phage tail sheath subtilisin-like domain-containing protein [Sphingomonas kyeonggiensis]MDQ0250955.1 phage tail sheath protein FI [Sphingomonas kyeonggiensis]